jgi:hypothetical protein
VVLHFFQVAILDRAKHFTPVELEIDLKTCTMLLPLTLGIECIERACGAPSLPSFFESSYQRELYISPVELKID